MKTETKTVRHRDGTTTTYERVRLPLAEVARRAAIWLRIIPVGTLTADGLRYRVEKTPRGYLMPNGLPATVTRLVISDVHSVAEKSVTMTRLGEYFGEYLETLDENGVSFWEAREKPNRWILADVFAV